MTSLNQETTVETLIRDHRPSNPLIAIVGQHTRQVFYCGNIDEIDPSTLNMSVLMMRQEEKRYIYNGYAQSDGRDIVYMIVVKDG